MTISSILSFFSRWLLDARLWIVFFFLFRLDNIMIPPLDEHSIRQTLTLSIARNLIEVSPDPLRPMMDFGAGGWEPRPVACEPPIYNAMIALTYKMFGEHDWFGRVINLVISSFGLWFFYSFLRRVWQNDRAALAAMVFFAVSNAFVYSRKAMPDTLALSFMFMACFYGLRYLEEDRRRDLWWYVVCLCVGMLAKLPMTCAVALLGIPLLREAIPWNRKWRLVAWGLIPLVLTYTWYFVWQDYLARNENGFVLYEAFGIQKGFAQLWNLRDGVWEMFFVDGHLKTWWALLLTLPGLYFMGRDNQRDTILALLAYTLLFGFFVLNAGYAYPTHDYYGIPYNPPLAMLAGYGAASLMGRWPILLFGYLCINSYDAIRQQKSDFFIHDHQRRYIGLEALADQFSARTDKFSTNCDVDTQLFYYLHRKGIGHTSAEYLEHPEWIADDGIRGKVKFIFIDKRRGLATDSLQYPVLFDSDDFRLYGLTVPR